MNSVKPKWKGVRPVRFSEEIFSILLHAVQNEKITVITIKNILKECRDTREEKRLRALRNQQPIKDSRRKKEEFLTKAEQFIRVLKRIELIEVEEDYLIPTVTCNEIIKYYLQGKEEKAKTKFLEIILNSKFESYKLFLFRLISSPIKIPSNLSKRNKELREFLQDNGFLLDMWSFFILRDFFYSFGLLNYIVTSDYEEIIAICIIDSKNNQFTEKITVNDKTIYYWKKIDSSKFIENLQSAYLEITMGIWNKVVDLIDLRDKFSKKYGISDIQFNKLFSESLEKKSKIQIIPSVGAIIPERKKGYLTKVIHLPLNKNGLPFTLLRMGPK